MRASSFLIFFILTFVLIFFSSGAPNRSLQNSSQETPLEEGDSNAEPAQMDSLAIPDINSRPTSSTSSTEPSLLKSKGYNFFPTTGIYNGPTATKELTTTLKFGLNFNDIYENFENIRIGLAFSTSSDFFFTISKQFMLAPQTWGNPYWNIDMNFAIDPTFAFNSFVNMENFTLGGSYGVRFYKNWSLEGTLGVLSLKGTSLGITAIYQLNL